MWIMDAPILKGAHKLLLLITKVPVAHNIYSLPSHVSQSRDGSGMEIKEKLTPQVQDSAETDKKNTPKRRIKMHMLLSELFSLALPGSERKSPTNKHTLDYLIQHTVIVLTTSQAPF